MKWAGTASAINAALFTLTSTYSFPKPIIQNDTVCADKPQLKATVQYDQIRTQGRTDEIRTPNTKEPDCSQHDRPSACVIAQQYSSATFFSIAAMKNSARVSK